MATHHSRRGFTLIDAAAVVATAGIGASIALWGGGAQPGAGQPQPDLHEALKKARDSARQLKCSSHVRGIVQAMIIWAQNNRDQYPLPSLVDKDGATLAGEPESKDTSASIFSMLIWNGFIPAEICISPAEASKRIKACKDYELDEPGGAVNPAKAMWDPKFAADFTPGKTGHLSYAHLQPFGDRLAKWANTFDANEAQVSNRGPEVASIDTDAAGLRTAKPKLAASLTYAIHGQPDRWEGNVGYADNHVTFETSYLVNDPGMWPTYTLKEGEKRAPDCLFFDERDGKDAGNLFLSIFTKAGKAAEDWTAIWD